MSTLTEGKSAGKGWKAIRYTNEGKMTDEMVSWSPGSSHHPEYGHYFKISSGLTGTIRVTEKLGVIK